MPKAILGEVKPAMQARVLILVTALVMIAGLVAALAMTAAMGLAMAMMMAMLPVAVIPVVTVRGSAHRRAAVAMVVAKESWAEDYGAGAGAAAHVTTARRCGMCGRSFRSGRAFAQAANGTDFLCSDKGVQKHAGGTARTGK